MCLYFGSGFAGQVLQVLVYIRWMGIGILQYQVEAVVFVILHCCTHMANRPEVDTTMKIPSVPRNPHLL